MPTYLLQLSHKKFMRAPQLEAKLAIKLLMGFVVLYFVGFLLFAGIAVYPILSDQFPERDPISIINSVLVLIFISELIIRYFLQQLPVTEIKSFLLLSIPKKLIIRNVLFRSLFSVYNATPVLFYLPISISMLQDDYALGQVIAWWLAVTAFSLCLNFISFLATKNNKALAGFVILIILLYLIESYIHVETLSAVGYFFDVLTMEPLWVLVPLGVFVLLYQTTFSFLKKNLNLEGSLAAKKEVANAGRYDFLEVFGSHALFLKNDLRLIVRNVRSKNIVMMSFLFLFYGLFFFTQDNQPESMLVFASIFVSGGFLFTYGGYVPAWDSEHYAFLMCQNLSYKKYLDSKWRLMTFAIVFSTALSLPYLYFGVKIYLLILSGAAFNIGLGTWITLYGGLLNKQPLKLNVKAKAFENTQAFSGKMMLMIFPKMVLPVLLYIIPATLFNPTVGYITLATSGVLGIVFKNQILTQMVKLFVKQKHEMLQAFTQK